MESLKTEKRCCYYFCLLRYIHSLTMCLMFPLFQALKQNKKIITTQCSVLLDLRTQNCCIKIIARVDEALDPNGAIIDIIRGIQMLVQSVKVRISSYVAIGSTLVIVLLMLLLIPGNNSSFVSSATRGHSNVAIDSKQQQVILSPLGPEM